MKVLSPGDRAVPWLGSVRFDPKPVPLKYNVQINGETLGESTPPALAFGYVDISSVDFVSGITAVEETTFEKAPSRARRVLRSGDTMVATVRTYLKAITIVEEQHDGLVGSTGFAVLRPKPGIEPRFLSYWMRCQFMVDEICARSTGVSYPAVNPSEIGSLPMPFLGWNRQRSIADFLDRKTAAIDELVRKKERLIELLEENRQALITQAVTKGLDPNVPMKDSGVEWIGEVPAHWEVKRLSAVASIVRGASPRPAGDPRYFDGADIPWVTVAEITRDESKFVTSTASGLTAAGRARSRVVRAGTLMLTNSGVTLGVPKVTSLDVCINDGVVAFSRIAGDVERDYLYWFLKSQTAGLRERIRQGQGQPNLNTSIVGGIPVSLPPKSEQIRIIRHLEEAVEGLAVVTRAACRQAELLREYRQALITAAVTGQLDVPAEPAA